MKKLINIFIIIFDLLIITVLFYLNNIKQFSVSEMSFIALIVSLYILLIQLPLKKGEGFIYSFYFVYIACLFSRAILENVFSYSPSSWFFDSFQFYSDIELVKAILLGIYSLVALHMGMLINRIVRSNKKVYVETIVQNVNTLKTTGWIIFVIAIIPSLINYKNQFLSFNSESINQNTETLIGMLSSLMLPFFIIMITTYKTKIPFLFGLLYYFPQLLWGGRGEPILSITILMFLYYKYVGDFKRVKIIFYGIASFATLNLFAVIKEVRSLPIGEWINKLPNLYIEKLMTSNPVFEVLYEVGVALAPTAAAIKLIPEDLSIQYGKTIIYSISTAIPDIFNIRPEVMSMYGNVPNLISNISGASFGGSILQDFYLNFMWVTPIVMVFVGIMLAKYSNYIKEEKDIVKISFYIILMFPILWWPRSSIGFLFRSAFVTASIPLFIYLLLKMSAKKKGIILKNETNKNIIFRNVTK